MSYTIELIFALAFMNCFGFIIPQRKLFTERAPGCRAPNCSVNVFYIRAVGLNDTIHYLWDFTSKPSLLLTYSTSNFSIEIDWDAFLNGTQNSIILPPPPNHGFLILIDEFIEFEDLNDTGFFSEGARNISFSSESFNWKYSNPVNAENSSSSVFYEMIGTNAKNKNVSLSGSAMIQLTAFGSMDHDAILPRLLHSANSSQVKVIMQGLHSDANLTNSRWAVKLSLISTSPKSENFLVESKKNLDDENSPGVFTMINVINTKPENDTLHSAFLQWRPVVYTSTIPSISNSSDVDIMDLTIISNPNSDLNGTLATKLFGDKLSHMLVEKTIVTFGSAQDGFYERTNYSSWAFLLSYGEPQTEGFSKLVILVMAIGLGLPAVLIIMGGLFVCSRRFNHRNDELSFEH